MYWLAPWWDRRRFAGQPIDDSQSGRAIVALHSVPCWGIHRVRPQRLGLALQGRSTIALGPEYTYLSCGACASPPHVSSRKLPTLPSRYVSNPHCVTLGRVKPPWRAYPRSVTGIAPSCLPPILAYCAAPAPRSLVANVWNRSFFALEDEFNANPQGSAVLFLRSVKQPGGRLMERRIRRQGGGTKLDHNIRIYPQ
jgi:hypothetical protein